MIIIQEEIHQKYSSLGSKIDFLTKIFNLIDKTQTTNRSKCIKI